MASGDCLSPGIHSAPGNKRSHRHQHRPWLLLDHGPRHGPWQQSGRRVHYPDQHAPDGSTTLRHQHDHSLDLRHLCALCDTTGFMNLTAPDCGRITSPDVIPRSSPGSDVTMTPCSSAGQTDLCGHSFCAAFRSPPGLGMVQTQGICMAFSGIRSCGYQPTPCCSGTWITVFPITM